MHLGWLQTTLQLILLILEGFHVLSGESPYHKCWTILHILDSCIWALQHSPWHEEMCQLNYLLERGLATAPKIREDTGLVSRFHSLQYVLRTESAYIHIVKGGGQGQQGESGLTFLTLGEVGEAFSGH